MVKSNWKLSKNPIKLYQLVKDMAYAPYGLKQLNHQQFFQPNLK